MKIASKIRFARRLAMSMIWGLVSVGLVLRFTIRDRYWPGSVVYYITPIPALPIWFLIAGLLGGRTSIGGQNGQSIANRSRYSVAHMNLVLGLFCLVWTLCYECEYRANPASSNDIRLVFWNVARVQAGANRLATRLKSWKAPVIALVEADENYKLKLADWQRELPGYRIVATGFGGLIAVEGTVKAYPDRVLAFGSYCQQFDLRVDGVDFTLLLVDITSNLRFSRRAPLDALAKLAEQLNDRPLVIVGDFNTPDDSIWFTPLREHFREAFREHGSGYAATWPMPLPVLTLDQVWVNELVDVSQCQHGWTACSDHRPVVSDISIRRRH